MKEVTDFQWRRNCIRKKMCHNLLLISAVNNIQTIVWPSSIDFKIERMAGRKFVGRGGREYWSKRHKFSPKVSKKWINQEKEHETYNSRKNNLNR